MVGPIRQRHLQELRRAATALPGPKAAAPRLTQLPPAAGAGDGAAPEGPLDAAARTEIANLRRLVHHVLMTLSERVERTLGPALEKALRAWDQADAHVILDHDLKHRLALERRRLEEALGSPWPAVRAVAVEAILALRAACALVELFERRLSPLIRLRVRSPERELLPNGRPFLDLAPALAEAARGWS
jgi:hypothetical protein